jgi:metallo-beta-lactamase family protein
MTSEDTLPAHRGPIVTFWGAAQMVTGSMHLLESGSTKVLLDCGLYQGRREESRQRNAQFPFHVRQIAAVLVSHAHIDHCGNLPSLVRHGFVGPIFCTPATRDLLAVMLADSAKIQEEDAAYLNIQRNYPEPSIEPLYTRYDVDRVLSQVVAIDYDRPREVRRGLTFKFLEAGHVLGSAMIHVTIDNGKPHTLTFTGDLGRRSLPLLRHTAPIPPAEVLVCESTYGNRTHEPIAVTAAKLYDAINRTIDRGGKVLIPAFSLGRTQLVIHFIHKGILENRIPRIPVYVDSPLAADITGVYETHPDALDDEGRQMLADGVGILGGDVVTYIREFEDSIRISRRPDPAIVIASSGMCDAGRILHHLKEHVDDPRCTIILVSYQAYGTTGRRLIEKSPTVKFLGREWNKWIEVVHLDGFSGHADRADFLAYLGPLAGEVGKVRLIHGEREQAESLAEALREIGFPDVGVPGPGDVVELG